VALSAEAARSARSNETAGARGGTTNVNYAVAARGRIRKGFSSASARNGNTDARLRQDGAVGPHRLDGRRRLHPRPLVRWNRTVTTTTIS